MRIPWRTWRPALVDALARYDRQTLIADVTAGVTVGVVALPLAMAFGIASGVTPQAGIYTAIVGGFLVSLLGGSSIRVSGPTGAFVVIVAGSAPPTSWLTSPPTCRRSRPSSSCACGT